MLHSFKNILNYGMIYWKKMSYKPQCKLRKKGNISPYT